MTRIVATTLALTLTLAATARAAPEDAGSLGVTKTTVQVQVQASPPLSLDTDVYVPQAAGPFPIVVIRHGWARNKSFWVNWGNHLASRGFVVLVPTSRAPYSPDPDRDSDDQLAVLAWGVAQSSVSGSPLEGKIDASRRAIGGHSAGGLCSVVGATKDSTLTAAVFFDEVDVNGTGVGAAPSIAIPSISLFAEPGTCNSQANGIAIFQAIGGPRYGIKIPGSQHCDPENPSDYLCGAACNGQVQAQYQTLYRRYATAFLEAFLNCDPAAYPYINGAFAQADTGITIYPATNIVIPPPGCGGGDGGTTQVDAGQADVPGMPDAIDYPDGTQPLDDAGNPVQDDAGAGSDAAASGDAGGGGGGGSGCGCRASGAAGVPLALLLVVALRATRRRRP
jgi:triacylglycerol lipase